MQGSVSLLLNETRKLLGIETIDCLANPNTRVVVRCNNCAEVFAREFCCVTQPHQCPLHLPEQNKKWCVGCSTYKTLRAYTTNLARYDGVSSICSECMGRLVDLAWGKANGLTSEQFIAAVDRQDGRCFLTREPLRLRYHGVNAQKLYDDKPLSLVNVIVVNTDSEHKSPPPSRIRLETRQLADNARLPFRKRVTDAGYDIHAAEDKLVPAQGYAIVSTNIAVSPPPGYYFTVECRSSLGLLGIIPIRGIIDGTYQGELKITLMNLSFDDYSVQAGDRIAQIVLHGIIHGDYAVVREFSPVVDGRRGDGFGSSGK